MTWTDYETPNLGKRKLRPTLIVLHHTGGHLAGDLATLTGKKKVSSDFVVAKDGRIFKLNPQLRQFVTWHAGVSAWKGRKNCNDFSFGIEQEHMPGEVWPDVQIKATAELCAWLITTFPTLKLENHCIQSHAAVALPHGRKVDPENYPWEQFSEYVKHFLSQAVNWYNYQYTA